MTESDEHGVRCPITGREDMIDDCHITIEFGYGSDKDLTTYTFSPVHDEVGKKVLEFIQSMMPCGSVEEFGEDVMEEYFGAETHVDWEWWDNLSDDEKRKKRKDWGME